MTEQSQASRNPTSFQEVTTDQPSAFVGVGVMLDAQVELSDQPLETDSA